MRTSRSTGSGRPSMADVGLRAGVSTQTVSRYFTGTGYVSAETRERITAAVDALGYRPNTSARSLRTQRTNTVGVLALGELNFGSSGVLTGLSHAARDAGFLLSIAHLDLDPGARDWHPEAHRAIDAFLSAPVDGIVISSPILGANELIPYIGDATPVVTVSERPPSPTSSAGTHSHTAAFVATTHLLELGHTRIAHLAGPGTLNESVERERGYVDAMRERGLSPQVLRGARGWSAVSGFEVARAVDPGGFTAVFASNDELALGLMSAWSQQGRTAPRDYSIVGVDDIPSAAYFSPGLTTMRLDFPSLGSQTFRMLHRKIETGATVEHVVVEPELIVRQTTARPR